MIFASDRKKHQQKLGEISKQHKADTNAKLVEDDLKRRKEEKKKM